MRFAVENKNSAADQLFQGFIGIDTQRVSGVSANAEDTGERDRLRYIWSGIMVRQTSPSRCNFPAATVSPLKGTNRYPRYGVVSIAVIVKYFQGTYLIGSFGPATR